MKNLVDWVAMLLVIVGGLNWGLVGLMNYNLVETLLGGFASGLVAKVVYDLVGLASLYMIYYAYQRK